MYVFLIARVILLNQRGTTFSITIFRTLDRQANCRYFLYENKNELVETTLALRLLFGSIKIWLSIAVHKMGTKLKSDVHIKLL